MTDRTTRTYATPHVWRDPKTIPPRGLIFSAWLERARVTEDREGNHYDMDRFMYDLRHDPDLPPTFASLKALRSYVGFKSGYDRDVLACAAFAWRRYKAWQRYYVNREPGPDAT
jgi:hypothetical protein